MRRVCFSRPLARREPRPPWTSSSPDLASLGFNGSDKGISRVPNQAIQPEGMSFLCFVPEYNSRTSVFVEIEMRQLYSLVQELDSWTSTRKENPLPALGNETRL